MRADGQKMTQSGPIMEYLNDSLQKGVGHSMLPENPWDRAEARRISWIIAADIQPYQNIPFIIQAMGEWDMVKSTPLNHPLRVHFILLLTTIGLSPDLVAQLGIIKYAFVGPLW